MDFGVNPAAATNGRTTEKLIAKKTKRLLEIT
jgi:hypothetical protein